MLCECFKVCICLCLCVCALIVPPVVEVLEPPFNRPLQERVANQRIAFPCPAKGIEKYPPNSVLLFLFKTYLHTI